MACDAAARLYDVDEDSVVFTKLDRTTKYDQGTVTFRARKDKVIDLDKLHESIWATRLSGGTRSGLVSLEVTTTGKVVSQEGKIVLEVDGTNKKFVLAKHSGNQHAPAFAKLQSSVNKSVKLSGIVDNYVGRWPSLFQKKPTTPRTILVTSVEVNE